jgi:nucleoside-diphosphate-sugar epimerase
MKLAVFGGTGFLGYNFISQVLNNPAVELVVYSSSPKSLVNITRHDIDLRLFSVKQLHEIELDPDTDFIVNFSHPFGIREELTPRVQIQAFLDFLTANKTRIPDLRLIHLSTMSVYEPFDKSIAYTEGSQIAPPRTDSYATEKAFFEEQLKRLTQSSSWQLHLRPTVVYGPFCRPWTDRIMASFLQGNVLYSNMEGAIQPVYGSDITRFIVDRLSDFQPGTYNFAGTETVTWKAYFEFFEAIVGSGTLEYDQHIRSSELGPSVSLWRFYRDNIRELLSAIVKHKSFDAMAVPIAKKLPRGVVIWVRDTLFGGVAQASSLPPRESLFASAFFSENRLVSMRNFETRFPSFTFTSM